MGNIDFDVKVCDGEYTYRQYKDGSQEALRHGEPWRDLCGDNFVRCLAGELNEARGRVAELEREVRVSRRDYEVMNRLREGAEQERDELERDELERELDRANMLLEEAEMCAGEAEHGVEELERERDELAALADYMLDGYKRAHSTLMWSWIEDMIEVAQNKPASALARRDARVAADVWHQVAIEVGPDGASMDMDALQNHAESERDRLRREAEGGAR